ncbi:Fe-S cluster assembly ATP-binding protein [Anaerotaenia torta]|uniref:Fe-S cluster assembly ATPase SufC n=1 Tax=Anaerotaenia torta TaxID=433293 RepID=UPI003D1FB725
MKQSLLRVCGLHAALETGEEVLRGVDLKMEPGEVHVIMGPNGSGKSTLANTIMGSPAYGVTQGQIEFDGEDITGAAVDVRAKKGIFMAFQTPEEIDGITVSDFLRTAKLAGEEKPTSLFGFKKQLRENMDALQLDDAYADRYLNVGFSGGEKKKSEILQLLTLRPKLAILDETDSGLDVDAVRVVTEGILRYKNEHNALLIISHSTRLLDALPVDRVHVLYHGRFVRSGDRGLIDEINTNGFARFIQAETR